MTKTKWNNIKKKTKSLLSYTHVPNNLNDKNGGHDFQEMRETIINFL